MKLSYDPKSKQFFAHVETRAENDELAKLPKWSSFSRKIHVTQDIQAAARFRPHADERAEKLFARAFVKTYALPRGRLPSFLDPHQVDGVSWVLSRSRSYLAHAPGAGKTAEAITSAWFTPGRGQVVFIVPPTLTANWAREIEKFTGYLDPGYFPTIGIVPESKHQESMGWSSDFLIVPDSMLTRPWVLDRLTRLKIKFIAADEASRFKEATALRTIALFGGRKKDFKSPGLIYSARHAVLLDGSPMPNRPMELWAPVFAMSPETIDFMSQAQFGFKYCGAQMNDRGEWEFKRSSHEAELRTRLQKNFMHVVSEDMLGHSARLRSLVFMNQDPRSPEQKAWERRFLQTISVDDLTDDNIPGKLSRMRMEVGLEKVEWSARYISERLESGERVLAFAWHREVCTKLQKALAKWKPHLIIGGTTPHDRERAFHAFQTGKSFCIVGNILSMGRGHNLQNADRIVFVEASWTDENNKQCEKRASRRGRDVNLPVKSDYLVIPGSIDERVLSAAFTKERRVKRVIG